MVADTHPTLTIDRCLCEGKSFADLLTIARRDQLDLPALAAREGCGTHCGWCIAYLRRGLQSGQSVFHNLLDKEPLNPVSPAPNPDRADRPTENP